MYENEAPNCQNCAAKEVKLNTSVCEKCYQKTMILMEDISKNRKVFYPEIDQINEKYF